MVNLMNLPQEILEKIAMELDVDSLRKFCIAGFKDSEKVWQHRTLQDWGIRVSKKLALCPAEFIESLVNEDTRVFPLLYTDDLLYMGRYYTSSKISRIRSMDTSSVPLMYDIVTEAIKNNTTFERVHPFYSGGEPYTSRIKFNLRIMVENKLSKE